VLLALDREQPASSAAGLLLAILALLATIIMLALVDLRLTRRLRRRA
jgi:hypothetical protein